MLDTILRDMMACCNVCVEAIYVDELTEKLVGHRASYVACPEKATAMEALQAGMTLAKLSGMMVQNASTHGVDVDEDTLMQAGELRGMAESVIRAKGMEGIHDGMVRVIDALRDDHVILQFKAAEGDVRTIAASVAAVLRLTHATLDTVLDMINE